MDLPLTTYKEIMDLHPELIEDLTRLQKHKNSALMWVAVFYFVLGVFTTSIMFILIERF